MENSFNLVHAQELNNKCVISIADGTYIYVICHVKYLRRMTNITRQLKRSSI